MGTPALQDKRLWLTLTSMLLVALNKKLGLSLGTEDLAAIAGLVAAYIAQSQWGAVKKAEAVGEEAAGAVQTTGDAVKALGGPGKTLALFLAVSLGLGAGVARADDAPAVEVKSAVLVTPDLATHDVKGGCYLSDSNCVARAKELTQLRAENAELKKSPGPAPLVVVGLVVLSLAVGAGGGYAVGKLAH